jgi:hypothetical protein
MIPNWKDGDKCLAFDYKSWQRTGDIGDNEQFFKKATIGKIYFFKGEYVADICWSHNNEISKSHFIKCLKPC